MPWSLSICLISLVSGKTGNGHFSTRKYLFLLEQCRQIHFKSVTRVNLDLHHVLCSKMALTTFLPDTSELSLVVKTCILQNILNNFNWGIAWEGKGNWKRS